MLGRCLMTYYATLEQAQFVAECGALRMILAPWLYLQEHDLAGRVYQADYYAWEDRATGGGGGRVTWYRGIVWVSCHSGYPQADITKELCELFEELGCKEVAPELAYSNPRIYGRDRIDDYLDA